MDTRADRLDRMLNVTVELFFELEQTMFFRQFGKRKMATLDIGCGNGAYAANIGARFPDMRLTGVEIDAEMYQKALVRQERNLTYIRGSYEQLHGNGSYDAVIARLVVLHIQNRDEFVKWVYDHTSNDGTVILIDFDDARYRENEKLPLFSTLYSTARQSLRRKRTFLELPDALRLEFCHGGFVHLNTERYTIRADRPDGKLRFCEYMRLATEYLLDAPISAERERELAAWLDDPDASHEIPMFGIRFGKSAEVR
ncbi:methyltransferase domain-containing protein [Paenibacillus hemerocallicola]|uniref:Methyltransferase domain-containing protein n=1 Tax=Paenibacillus hemerocallicola TaxID=1172614 RepID=A0A5C4TGC8_9BACL|nr:class I SAM-dependent methyltransferase [Paenibacillus hemerocallicola]TNJ68153.1 methyltransferase domain-containing protein [Paenibacillus hemerocallicola]